MILTDTSVWIEVLRDAGKRPAFEAALGGEAPVFSRFTQLELLQGARNEGEWATLESYLDGQDYLEASPASWAAAARMFYELRREGTTVRSPIDCCIAQLAIENDIALLHCDRDFEALARVRNLRQRRVDFEA